MRHNVMLSKENSELLKSLEKSLGLKPSAIFALGLQSLKRQQGRQDIDGIPEPRLSWGEPKK